MPPIDRHLPGTFNWVELATSDQEGAKTFYSQLFGWTFVDSPMGPDQTYTMFQLEGLDTGAAYTLKPEMRENGVPSHWDVYVAVESADETAAKVESFGGNLIARPFDVMSYGRMAVASDPTGAAFCLWQPKNNIGIQIAARTGTVCWADLNTPDAEAASLFYSGLFGWEMFQGENDPSGYLHIKMGKNHIGGIYPVQMPSNMPAHWMIYFSAADADALTAKALELGGKTMVPVTEIPNAGKFSVVQDPQGAVFALFEPRVH